jgi:hypothetical protein
VWKANLSRAEGERQSCADSGPSPPHAATRRFDLQRPFAPVLLNDLVGADKDRWRHGEAEFFRGLEVDDQLQLRRLLDRQIGRLGSWAAGSGGRRAWRPSRYGLRSKPLAGIRRLRCVRRRGGHRPRRAPCTAQRPAMRARRQHKGPYRTTGGAGVPTGATRTGRARAQSRWGPEGAGAF